MTDEPRYDVYIAAGERDAKHAARLRRHLTNAGFSVNPAVAFSEQAVLDARAVVALMNRRKPDDPVRAAMAAAQDIDRPIITVYHRDGEMALRKRGHELLYMSDNEAMVLLIRALWQALDDPRAAYDDHQPDESWQAWLARQQKQ